MTYTKFKLFLAILFFIMPHHLFFILYGSSEYKPTDIISIFMFLCLAYDLFRNCFVKRDNFLNIEFSSAIFSSPLLYFVFLSIVYLLRSFIPFVITDNFFSNILFGLKFSQYLIIIFFLIRLELSDQFLLFKIFICSIFFWLFLNIFDLNFSMWELKLLHYRFSAHFAGPYELCGISLLLIFLYWSNVRKFLFLLIGLITQTKAFYLSLLPLILKDFFVISKIKKILFLGTIFAIICLPRTNIFVMNVIPNITQLFIMVKHYTYPYVTTHDIAYSQFINRENIFAEYGLSNYMDLSSFSRLFTYISLFNSLDLFSLLVGNGPGFYGKAVDSSILRILGETGILGFTFFYMTLKKLSFIFNKKIFLFSFVLFISLSDIFFTVRFICFLFLVHNLFTYGFFKR